LRFEPGESGLPQTSWLKGHFISIEKISACGALTPKALGFPNAISGSQFKRDTVLALIGSRLGVVPLKPEQPSSRHAAVSQKVIARL
jgi:hypothetical protein